MHQSYRYVPSVLCERVSVQCYNLAVAVKPKQPTASRALAVLHMSIVFRSQVLCRCWNCGTVLHTTTRDVQSYRLQELPLDYVQFNILLTHSVVGEAMLATVGSTAVAQALQADS